MSSPAQRYAAAMARQQRARSELGTFAQTLTFDLDEFQQQACAAVEAGRGVLVAAPTGAGKTVVGEFAVHLALARGRKAFYTTPIKALSNQKFADLVARHGAENVGLLTGDTAINGDAAIVIMTTEVLRNMLYANSPALAGLGYVVMDEVHYLADRFRGPVWEEVILHLSPDVQLVSLSATVSNAEEFGDWLTEVRGDTTVVVSEHRPVPLWQHVMVGQNIHDLYSSDVDPTRPGVSPPISPDLTEAIRAIERSGDRRRGARDSRGRGRHHQRGPAVRPPHRSLVVDRLDRAGLLPAIVFIFSRAGCDAAVAQVVHSGVRLTTPDQRREIAAIVADRTSSLPPGDLDVLGFDAWEHALLAGVAAHHAGLLPAFKETVELLFTKGLVKLVFATETLALGINMPARSVVLEKLVKWDGSGHAAITAGEYTQLTGRAGRRGIDIEGHAVVLYGSGLDPVALAGLASRRTYPLRSSFRPTYNMAVNLIASTGWERAREVLEMSFAQFQADRGVVGLARQARSHAEALAGYAQSMTCHLGDFTEYMDLRRSISTLEGDLSRARSRAQREAVTATIASLRRGDVVSIPTGRRAGYAVVLDTPIPGFDGGTVAVLTSDGQVRKLAGVDLPYGTQAVTSVKVPKSFSSRRPKDRRDLASSIRNALGALADGAPPRLRKPHSAAVNDDELTGLRRQLRAHACHGCADREEHARWAHRYYQLKDEHDALVGKIEGRTASIAREFDRVCAVLSTLGYLDGERGQTSVTNRGQWLRRVYSERDLLIVECLRRGHWDRLDAPGLAAVVAAVLYESRSDDLMPRPRVSDPLAQAISDTEATARELATIERDGAVKPKPPLDLGLVMSMQAWARGAGLDKVITADLAAGDFVRWAKQVIDVLDQLTIAAPQSATKKLAAAAVTAVRRGIVALGSV